MKNKFLTLFEDVGHERMLILPLSVTDANIFNQKGFTEPEMKISKTLLQKNFIDRKPQKSS